MIGVDTAKSLIGDFCAIEIFEYDSFKQIGELCGRFGSLKKFSDIISDLIEHMKTNHGDNFIVGIENNTFGAAILENIEEHEHYLFNDDSQRDPYKYGINTNSKTKDQMITIFYDYINQSPELINSSMLIDQLSIIERKSNGSISARSGYHDDLFMSSCLCAYMRKHTLNPTINQEDIGSLYTSLVGVVKKNKNKFQEEYDEILDEDDKLIGAMFD